MWLKSKSIPKVNSSILKVFEPKFSIFVKQQYPSFSTSIQRNVATWGLWYANTFVDFFSHNNDQHFETFCFRLIQYVPLVFSGNITFKTVCCYNGSSFFLTWFPMSWLFLIWPLWKDEKLAVDPFNTLEESKYQCWYVVWRKRCQFRFSHCFVANLLHNIVVLDTNAFQVFSRGIIYFLTTFVSEYHSKPANHTSRNRN